MPQRGGAGEACERDDAGPRPRGRPREPETDRRILEAAFRLMLQSGYARLSIDQVAEEAGVGRPTIYRRYRGKEELAIAALAAAQIESLVLPRTGETRADLVTHLRRFARAAGRPYGMAMIGTVLAEEHETPELLRHFREEVVAPRRRIFRGLLEHAQERGELCAGVDPDLAVNLLVGAYYAQYLEGRPFDDGWAERVVDTLLVGIGRG